MKKEKLDNIEKFIEANKIDKDLIKNSKESKIITIRDINPLAYFYGIYTDYKIQEVSVTDIIGHNDSTINKENILDNLETYFSRNERENIESYATRNLKMLEYTTYNIIDKLQRSFTKDYITVAEIEPNKLVITQNGLHRYHLLRILYINEKEKNKDNKTLIEFLKTKYTIPVKLEKLDYIKTYCYFLLYCLDLEYTFSIEKERTEDYKETGNIILNYDNTKTILSDSQLIKLIKQNISLIKQNSIAVIMRHYNNISSFKQFIDENFEELKLETINNRVI